jgi:hypothetical protein
MHFGLDATAFLYAMRNQNSICDVFELCPVRGHRLIGPNDRNGRSAAASAIIGLKEPVHASARAFIPSVRLARITQTQNLSGKHHRVGWRYTAPAGLP